MVLTVRALTNVTVSQRACLWLSDVCRASVLLCRKFLIEFVFTRMDIKLSNSAAQFDGLTYVPTGNGNVPCFKVILCGDYGVGKTSLFRRFYLDDFCADDDDAAKSSMLGMDFSTRQFHVGDGCSAKLQLWDTAGIERYASLSPNYYKQSSAIIVCYATDNRLSLSSVANHVTVAASHCACVPPVYFICGSRSDCVSPNMVSSQDVERVTSQLSVSVTACYTVSAATGRGVDDMFVDVARRLADTYRSAAEKTRTVTVVNESRCFHSCCTIQ